MSDTACRFCDREVVPGDKEVHGGSLCGSCWEVCYRIKKLMAVPAFREFVERALEATEGA